jgi:hypothetical protein
MAILPRLTVLAVTLLTAGMLSAATGQIDWPTCAGVSVMQDGPKTLTLTCAEGKPPAVAPSIVIDFPQCSSLALWGRGESLQMECPVGNAEATTGSVPGTLTVYGCGDVSVWGGSDRVSVDCIADPARRRVQEAYVAYYGRPGDPGGVDYWTQRIVADGDSLRTLIDDFSSSPEFRTRYGGLDHTGLVIKVYQQALGRDPEPAGLALWVDKLDRGVVSLGTIALNILDGASGGDATVVANRLHVADYYTLRVAAGCAYGTETHAAGLIGPILTTNASVADAIAAIDRRCGAPGA